MKFISKKALTREVAEAKEEIAFLRTGYKELSTKCGNLLDKYTKLQNEHNAVKMENDMLRRYFKLNEEPGEEIRLRAQTDIDLLREKWQNFLLKSALSNCVSLDRYREILRDIDNNMVSAPFEYTLEEML